MTSRMLGIVTEGQSTWPKVQERRGRAEIAIYQHGRYWVSFEQSLFLTL